MANLTKATKILTRPHNQNHTMFNSIPGWCTPQQMRLLNELINCLQENEKYLEIGTYCGRSLAAALFGNQAQAIVIDPMQCNNNGRPCRDIWQETIDLFDIADRVRLIQCRCEDLSDSMLPQNIGLFYYDGNHDSGHTYEGLCKFEQCLSDEAIIIVDDLKIAGGNQQCPYPGHDIQDVPVEFDVKRWLTNNESKIVDKFITPWLNHQIVMLYRRSR